jgi:hypothetical protein
MEDFKVRMLDELKSLQEKIGNLEKFICTDTKFKDLNFKHRTSLRVQVFFMRQYAFWLSTRIGWWLTPEDLEEYNTPTTPLLVDEPVSEVVAEKKPKVKRKARKNTKHE